MTDESKGNTGNTGNTGNVATPAHAQAPDELNALPAGTRFGELEILRTLGVGGFGIVYLAQDHALEREVAIKEYMPGQLAQRGDGSQVSVRSNSLVETFDIGRRSFVNEARLLARFDHRSLLKVYRFWEANGTAYMVMPYLQGQTLRQARESMQGRPSQAWLLRVITPILDGLALLHGAQVYHRDVAPDNVLLPPGDADPILLDFGAARRAIGDRTQSFTAILKPSYAPIEQYAESAGLRQGPWTDVYAIGAMLHYLVLGRTPPPATTRTFADEYRPLATQDLPGLAPKFLAAIDWALGVRPQDRPQSVGELRGALLGERDPPAPAPAENTRPIPATDFDKTVVMPRTGARPAESSGTQDMAATIAVPRPGATPAPTPAEAPQAPAPTRKPPLALVGGLAALLLVAGGGAWWALRGNAGAAQEGTRAAAEAASAVAAVAVAPSAVPPASAPASIATSGPADSSKASAPAGPVVPQSRVATVNLPDPAATASSAAARPARAASAPLAAPLRPVVQKAAPLPVPAPVPAAKEEPLQAESPPLPPPKVVEAAASQPSGPLDPRASCGKRVFLAMIICMERACARPEFASHPECVNLHGTRDNRGRN